MPSAFINVICAASWSPRPVPFLRSVRLGGGTRPLGGHVHMYTCAFIAIVRRLTIPIVGNVWSITIQLTNKIMSEEGGSTADCASGHDEHVIAAAGIRTCASVRRRMPSKLFIDCTQRHSQSVPMSQASLLLTIVPFCKR